MDQSVIARRSVSFSVTVATVTHSYGEMALSRPEGYHMYHPDTQKGDLKIKPSGRLGGSFS